MVLGRWRLQEPRRRPLGGGGGCVARSDSGVAAAALTAQSFLPLSFLLSSCPFFAFCYGGASYCLNGQYIHYVCRSQKCISLSSMESEYYSAVGSSCQGLFMKAVVEFMSRSPCDLIVNVDNQSCKAFCLRQGVTKASKHFEGRLLWLQDAVQQKRLIMKYVSTHANLGDIHTKPLSPARLQSLLFLHDFVDMHDRPVGSEEWDRTDESQAG